MRPVSQWKLERWNTVLVSGQWTSGISWKLEPDQAKNRRLVPTVTAFNQHTYTLPHTISPSAYDRIFQFCTGTEADIFAVRAAIVVVEESNRPGYSWVVSFKSS